MKKLLFKQSYCFLFFLVFLLSGCIKYTPHPLVKPERPNIEKNDVKISTKLLTRKDCRHYFNRNCIRYGFQPIQLCIENNSDKLLVLNLADINLPLEQKELVARSLNISKKCYIIPGIAISLLSLIPICLGTIGIVSAIHSYHSLADTTSLMCATNSLATALICTCFILPLALTISLVFTGVVYVISLGALGSGIISLITSLGSMLLARHKIRRFNKKLNADFANRVVDKTSVITLKPHSEINTVFFIKNDVAKKLDQFDVKLYDPTVDDFLSFNLITK